MQHLPEIKSVEERKFAGKKLTMSYAQNRTVELWGSFMPRRKEIINAKSNLLYSVQRYGCGFYEEFDPDRIFEKWAVVEVPDFSQVPEGMETLIIPKGEYAVFVYRGRPGDAAEFFRYIFSEWLPASGWKLALRPHFEVIGDRYKHDDPDSEEEVWIPIDRP
jgi:AraC family transcriptional regulator